MPTIRLLFALALQPAKAVLERPTSKWPFRALLRGRVRAKWKRYSCDSSAMNRSRIADDEQFILYARVVGNIPAVSILCFFFLCSFTGGMACCTSIFTVYDTNRQQ